MDYDDDNSYAPIDVMKKIVTTVESHYGNLINIILITMVMLNALVVTNSLKHRLR